MRHLLPLVPASYGRYFEPFFGGGALFFALQPGTATISDKNENLMSCYKEVRDRPHEIVAALCQMPNSEFDYYQIRESEPDDPIVAAARLIYLTTLSFNGIHRVNLRGRFNVPYGHKSHLDPSDPVPVLRASAALQSVEIQSGDFEDTLSSATAGDFVYLDPPYTVAHGQNGFVKYNAKIFSWADQVRLAKTVQQLDESGCNVVVSNADHASVRTLYPNFAESVIQRSSKISASANFRRVVTESVFFSLRLL